MTNRIKIDIPYKSSLANIVTSFAATFESVNSYCCDGFNKENNEYIPDLKIPFGETILNFQNEKIKINFEEEGSPVGLYFSAEKYQNLSIQIDTNLENNIEEKKKVIFNFLEEARKFYDKKLDNEILCKILKNGNWSTLSKLPKRDLNTIYLDQDKKDKIFNDLKLFFKREELYSKYGIPYKRNYLLEGVPGTGKSSLIFALASYFNMNIHIIHLGPKVDDCVFMSAINALPNNTILLLEDIDALFVDRKANDVNKSMVSFSGILNVLDGVGRKNKLITFMTSNYKDRLDKALIRPGRIDFIMNFDYSSKEQIKQMFDQFRPKQKADWKKFYNKISHLQLTTATLQKFFFDCIEKENILDHINYLKQIIDDQKPDNNVKAVGNLYL
tara:strand:- start:1586 stop:2743 length:1158 start_codon:yes stop_codon:yes gene_type:complete